jgi:hypothetical protein
VTALLLYGDTEHSAAMRHEVPIAILDPFLYASDQDRAWIMCSGLERRRVADCRPEQGCDVLTRFTYSMRPEEAMATG